MARQKMSNKDLQGFLNATYNQFLCKWRNNVPELNDAETWDRIWSEAQNISKQYERFEEDGFRPCSKIIEAFLMILDDRKRT